MSVDDIKAWIVQHDMYEVGVGTIPPSRLKQTDDALRTAVEALGRMTIYRAADHLPGYWLLNEEDLPKVLADVREILGLPKENSTAERGGLMSDEEFYGE
jgi:hypothetical protein